MPYSLRGSSHHVKNKDFTKYCAIPNVLFSALGVDGRNYGIDNVDFIDYGFRKVSNFRA